MKAVESHDIQRIAGYFNACFQADNRAHSLWDLFAEKNEFLQLANKQQLEALQQQGACELDWVYGSKLEKHVAMYRREKMLLFGQYFIFAQLPISGGLSNKLTRICAPLLLFEASLSEGNKQIELSIDRSMYRWNSHLLSVLFDDKDIELKLQDFLHEETGLDLSAFLQHLESSRSVVTEWTLAEPITQATQLQAAKNASKKQFLTAAPGGCFVFTKRSTASRGIIDELNVMAETTHLSQALTRLLANHGAKNWISNRCQIENVPGILSKAQQQALNNAAKKDLSVLIGPPGTGKSYTIACIILERFLQGESVLLVTQNESAVDVVQEKLIEQLDISASAIIRSGNKDYHHDLKRKLAEILGGMHRTSGSTGQGSLLKDILKEIKRTEVSFIKEAEKAVKDGLFIDGLISGQLSNHWFNRFKRWLIMGRVAKQQPLAQQLSDIHALHSQREATLAEHINNLYQTVLHGFLQENRKHLVKFDSALRARTSMGQKNRFLNVDYQLLLQALPIWLSSLSALHRSLPMKPELFDLVIIDEATQCDIASCLPALHRAKRVMVVGDPKQLRHLSFLSSKKQQQILEKHGLEQLSLDLNYRDQSMIDLAATQVTSQDSVVMLDEHYRSMPDIIGFSNELFYKNQLRVMTAKPTTAKKAAIRLIQVPDGVRQNGVNVKEVNLLIDKLNEILAFQQQLPEINQQSIGILAFFREQADAIQKVLLKHYTIQTLRKHKIRAATPYGFQGEERDIMLISCGVDAETPNGAYRYLNRPDVFNVGITRARDLQYVFVSASPEQMTSNCLLYQYIAYIKRLKAEPFQQLPRLHDYMAELCHDIHQQGMKTVQHYVVAGVVMDLVVVLQDQVLAIDLIGFPGEYHDVLHIDRYKMFSRAELTIYPLSLSAWLLDKDTVVEEIYATLKDKHQQSLRNISIANKAQAWKKINPIDALMAKQVKKVEFNLMEADLEQCVQQLQQLIEQFCDLNFNLSQAFNVGELTWLRYQDSINSIMKSCLQRYAKIYQHNEEAYADQNTSMLAENQAAIKKLQQAKTHLTELLFKRQPQTIQMTYEFSAIDDLNEKVKYISDMDDL